MLTTLVIGVLALAAMAAVASGVFFLRARERESAVVETDAAAADGLAEMRALGQRIETLVGQQQLQGATDRQHLAQKIDAVGEHLEQQRHGLSGLQNELRHEVHRRDAEMDQIRTQLASIQHATALGAVAGAPPLALPPAADTPPFEAPAFETPAFETPAFETPAFETPAFEAPDTEAPFPAEPMGDGIAADFDEAPFTPSASADEWDTGATDPKPASESAAPPAFSDPFAFVDPFAAPPAATPEPAPVADADEPAVAADAEFEPFDFMPPTSGDEDDFQLPALEPAAPPPANPPSLFEDVSFGGPAGVAFDDFATVAAPAPTEAPAYSAPAPPSESAWVARADRPAADVPTFASGLGAVPSAPSPAPVPEAPAPVAEAPAFEAPTFQIPTFEVPAFEAPAFEAPAPAFETPAPAPAAPAAEPAPAPTAPAPTAPAPAAPAPAAPAAEPAPEPPPAPAGADVLTVISTVTDDIQRLLYDAGVTSLDEIARWSRTDARRISSLVSISEETILNQWVFEAQAALFQSFRA